MPHCRYCGKLVHTDRGLSRHISQTTDCSQKQADELRHQHGLYMDLGPLSTSQNPPSIHAHADRVNGVPSPTANIGLDPPGINDFDSDGHQGNSGPDSFAPVDLLADGDLSSVNSSRRVASSSTQSCDGWSVATGVNDEECHDDFPDDNQDFELGYEYALARAQQEHQDRTSGLGDRGIQWAPSLTTRDTNESILLPPEAGDSLSLDAGVHIPPLLSTITAGNDPIAGSTNELADSLGQPSVTQHPDTLHHGHLSTRSLTEFAMRGLPGNIRSQLCYVLSPDRPKITNAVPRVDKVFLELLALLEHANCSLGMFHAIIKWAQMAARATNGFDDRVLPPQTRTEFLKVIRKRIGLDDRRVNYFESVVVAKENENHAAHVLPVPRGSEHDTTITPTGDVPEYQRTGVSRLIVDRECWGSEF